MERSGTHVRYLLAIYQLAKIQTEFSPMEIAKAMGASKASVTRMMALLMEKHLLVKKPYGKVYLTGTGF